MTAVPDDLLHELRQAQKRAYYSRIAWSDANDTGNTDLASAAARVYEADVQEVIQLRAPLLSTQDAINQLKEDFEAARWPRVTLDVTSAKETAPPTSHAAWVEKAYQARLHRDATP